MKPLVNQKSLLVLLLSLFFQLQAFCQSISGATTVCPNTTVRYTFVGSGCTSVTWGNVQGPAPVTIVEKTSTYIDIQFPRAATSAPYRINAGYVCGGSSNNATLDVRVRQIPQSRTLSREIPCNYRGGQMFDMDLTGDDLGRYTAATWTNGPEWTVAAGPTTRPRNQGPVTIYYSEIDFLVNNSNAGIIKGTAVGYCPSTPYEVTYNIARPTSTTLPAPVMSVPTTFQCTGATSTFSVAPYLEAISYTWSSNSPNLLINGQHPPVTISAANNGHTVGIRSDVRGSALVTVKAQSTCGETPTASAWLDIGILRPVPLMYVNGTTYTQSPVELQRFSEYILSVDPMPYATSYKWVLSSNLILLSGQGTNQVYVIVNGSAGQSISISVEAENSCAPGGGFVLNGQIVGSGEGELSSAFDVYPNPATNEINIRNSVTQPGLISTATKHRTTDKPAPKKHEIRQVNIYDNSGKLVTRRSYPKGQEGTNLAVGSLTPGIYHVEIISDIIERKKIIIQR